MSDFLYTRQDLREWVQSQLSVGAGSTQFTPTRINMEINNAYILWACSKYNWKPLERAKTTSTKANSFYYDYPANFKLESISRLEISGKKYDKKDYDDFLQYKIDNPNDTNKRIFANHETFFFVFPTPATDGVNNLDIWGFIVPNVSDARAKPLTLDTDKTIFSDSAPEVNLAIVKQTLALLKPKAKDKKEGQIEDVEAAGILATAFNKTLGNKQTEQQLNNPMFSHTDFLK